MDKNDKCLAAFGKRNRFAFCHDHCGVDDVIVGEANCAEITAIAWRLQFAVSLILSNGFRKVNYDRYDANEGSCKPAFLVLEYATLSGNLKGQL